MKAAITFCEARQALETAQNEYKRDNELSLVGAFAAIHSCYLAVDNLYNRATGSRLPQNRFVSYPMLDRIVSTLGILPEYEDRSRQFLEQLTDRALDEILCVGSQAYRYYKKVKSGIVAGELLAGAQRFICETEHFAGDQRILELIRMNSPVNIYGQASWQTKEACPQMAEV
jgi:hypothetical protein